MAQAQARGRELARVWGAVPAECLAECLAGLYGETPEAVAHTLAWKLPGKAEATHKLTISKLHEFAIPADQP